MTTAVQTTLIQALVADAVAAPSSHLAPRSRSFPFSPCSPPARRRPSPRRGRRQQKTTDSDLSEL
mgnify:CR=1 FL=1